VSPVWAEWCLLPKGRKKEAARLTPAISPYMWGLDLTPGWHLFWLSLLQTN